jgi:hypothetical protein
MADPFPSVALPQTNIIELFNCRDSSFNLYGWKLQIGNIIRDIPEFSIDWTRIRGFGSGCSKCIFCGHQ